MTSTSVRSTFFIWLAILAISAYALACGALLETGEFGFASIEEAAKLLYYAAAMLGFEPPPVDEAKTQNPLFVAARITTILLAVFAAFGIIAQLFRPVADIIVRTRMWFERVVLQRRPVVVFGLGWIGGPIATDARRSGRPVYGVNLDEESPRVLEARRSGALVVVGDATDDETQKLVPLPKADHIFVATGDDARNVEIAGELLQASAKWPKRRRPRFCFVHLSDPGFAEVLAYHDLWGATAIP